MRRILVVIFAALLLNSCGIYSFSGTSIQPDVKTITINFFEYKALKVNPTLSNTFTEELRNKFRRMTRLEQVDYDGDLEITSEISGYEVTATAITASEQAAQNRLTVTVKVSFHNKKYPEDNFENKTFSSYADFPSDQLLDSVESSLCAEIVEKINEEIFNATVAQW